MLKRDTGGKHHRIVVRLWGEVKLGNGPWSKRKTGCGRVERGLPRRAAQAGGGWGGLLLGVGGGLRWGGVVVRRNAGRDDEENFLRESSLKHLKRICRKKGGGRGPNLGGGRGVRKEVGRGKGLT